VRRVVADRAPLQGERVALDAVASHHLLHVIRLARGEQVRVVDGRGSGAIAVLDGLSEGRAVLLGVAPLAQEAPPRRVVLLGLPRGPLLEEALTLGTEVGASCFVLARCRRSPPGDVRADRLQRILRAAVTQCGRMDVPEVVGPLGFVDALRASAEAAPDAERWMCEGGGVQVPPPEGACVVAVGPEGGFDAAERDALAENGFGAVGLGPYVLRTPTAVATALARAFNSRW
jgi:16S rRNA (uracil1498-N3)-methyltransferase